MWVNRGVLASKRWFACSRRANALLRVASLELTACIRPMPSEAPAKPAPELAVVQHAFDAQQWPQAAELALELLRSRCTDRSPADPECYAAKLVRARSLVKLSRICEALVEYDSLHPTPDTAEAAEFGALKDWLGRGAGARTYPVRLELVAKAEENVEVVSAQAWLDFSGGTLILPLARSVGPGCHIAKIDMYLRGSGNLRGYKFRIETRHFFDSESVATVRTVVTGGPTPRDVRVHYEDLPRARQLGATE